MVDLAERIAVAVVVLAAAGYLMLRWSGVLARLRARSRPDVPVSRLVRKKKPDCDHCER